MINVNNAEYDGLIFNNQLHKKKILFFAWGKQTHEKIFILYCYSHVDKFFLDLCRNICLQQFTAVLMRQIPNGP